MIACVCAVTGAWADDTSGTLTNGSTWSYDSGVLTITFSSQNDYTGQILNDLKNNSLSSSPITKLVINTASEFTLNTATSNSNTGGQDELYAFDGVILDLSSASLTPATNYGVTYYPMDGNGNNRFKNVIVPDAYKSDPSQFILTQAYNSSASPINAYSVDGTTINASFGATSNLVNLNNISSTATTLKVVADISGAIDLSTVASSSNSAITAIDLLSVTTGNDDSNTITVPSTVSVTCGTTEVGNRVSGVTPTLVFNGIASVTTTSSTNLSSSIATLLSSYSGATASQITSLTVTGPLTAEDITYISTTLTGLTTLDLTNATGDVSSLASSTLTTLTLPSSATALPNNIATALPALTSPIYVYSYSNNTLNSVDIYVPSAGQLSSAVDALNLPRLGNMVLLNISHPQT